MKRRNFILGLGTTIAGGTAVLGSGAFSSVEAERTVTVETANDDDAYLRLTTDPNPSDDRSFRTVEDGQIAFRFPGLRETLEDTQLDTNPQNPEGLGEDTLYRFAQDTNNDPLFRAENQGTQPIEIYGFQDDPNDVPKVAMFNVDTGGVLRESTPSAVIGVGEYVDLGLQIDTYGVELRDDPYDLTLTIVAEATNA